MALNKTTFLTATQKRKLMAVNILKLCRESGNYEMNMKVNFAAVNTT